MYSYRSKSGEASNGSRKQPLSNSVPSNIASHSLLLVHGGDADDDVVEVAAGETQDTSLLVELSVSRCSGHCDWSTPTELALTPSFSAYKRALIGHF